VKPDTISSKKKKKVGGGNRERRVIRHTKITVVNANKFNPLNCKNTISTKGAPKRLYTKHDAA